MPRYVDGFVLPVPKKNLRAYIGTSRKACKVWREHGAVEFRECVGDDLKVKMGMSFPALVKPKAGETVVFSWITYKSRAHRDRVNAKVMKDPHLNEMMGTKPMAVDVSRVAEGGFGVMVDA